MTTKMANTDKNLKKATGSHCWCYII